MREKPPPSSRHSSIAQCNCCAREGYEFLSNQEKNLSPRLETVAVLEALGIHCAPLQDLSHPKVTPGFLICMCWFSTYTYRHA